MWTVDGIVPVRCRIAANANSFYFHYGQTAKVECQEPRAPRSWHGTHPCQPCKAPLHSPQSTREPRIFLPSCLILPSQPRNDAFRLGKPLLRYKRSSLQQPHCKSSPRSQYQSSSSTPSPYYQRTDSWRAVRFLLAVYSGNGQV